MTRTPSDPPAVRQPIMAACCAAVDAPGPPSIVVAMSANRTEEFKAELRCLPKAKTVPWVYKVHSSQSGASAAVMVKKWGGLGVELP